MSYCSQRMEKYGIGFVLLGVGNNVAICLDQPHGQYLVPMKSWNEASSFLCWRAAFVQVWADIGQAMQS